MIDLCSPWKNLKTPYLGYGQKLIGLSGSVVALRGVLGGKQAAPLLWKIIVPCSGGVVSTQLHHEIEGTKVLRATIWVMGGMLRRAAQAYLETGWGDRKRECRISENTLFQTNTEPQNTREHGGSPDPV